MIRLLAYFFFVIFALPPFHSYALPAGVKIDSNIQYGDSKAQALDVYYPSFKVQEAPVIFMVHGGAWRIGDKASRGVVKNKVDHWVSKGFIFISINYRLIPEAYPVEQAKDVEKALMFVKDNVNKWGGSPEKLILMGHSSGAHLVSLVSARQEAAIKPWLGTIALDSAAYDIEKIMNSSSTPRVYTIAFGKRAVNWRRASPIHALKHKISPFLAVCSSVRRDYSCSQAENFVEKAKKYGGDARLIRVDFSHREVNSELGKDNCYTLNIDAFIRKLHPSLKSMLTSKNTRTQQSCAGA